MVSKSNKTHYVGRTDHDYADLKGVKVQEQKTSLGYSVRQTIGLIASLGIQLICELIISQYDTRHVRECDKEECLGRIARLFRVTRDDGPQPIIDPARPDLLNRPFYVSYSFAHRAVQFTKPNYSGPLSNYYHSSPNRSNKPFGIGLPQRGDNTCGGGYGFLQPSNERSISRPVSCTWDYKWIACFYGDIIWRMELEPFQRLCSNIYDRSSNAELSCTFGFAATQPFPQDAIYSSKMNSEFEDNFAWQLIFGKRIYYVLAMCVLALCIDKYLSMV
jgi:hypothetical protein